MENLIEDKTYKNKKGEGDGEEKKKRPVIKSATDLQRLKLEKLMKNPDKPIIIPEPPREKDYMQTVPSFVRNVMGSSAGAGSGEFHVYRHLRRKEYARQKCIQAKSMREQLDDEYQSKLEKNRLEAETKTAKKRAKRLKKKQRVKKPKTMLSDEKDEVKQETSEDDDEDQGEEENSTVIEQSAENTSDNEVEEDSSTNVADRQDDVVGPAVKENTDEGVQAQQEKEDVGVEEKDIGCKSRSNDDQQSTTESSLPEQETKSDIVEKVKKTESETVDLASTDVKEQALVDVTI